MHFEREFYGTFKITVEISEDFPGPVSPFGTWVVTRCEDITQVTKGNYRDWITYMDSQPGGRSRAIRDLLQEDIVLFTLECIQQAVDAWGHGIVWAYRLKTETKAFQFTPKGTPVAL